MRFSSSDGAYPLNIESLMLVEKILKSVSLSFSNVNTVQQIESGRRKRATTE